MITEKECVPYFDIDKINLNKEEFLIKIDNFLEKLNGYYTTEFTIKDLSIWINDTYLNDFIIKSVHIYIPEYSTAKDDLKKFGKYLNE